MVIEKFLRDRSLKYHGGFSMIEGLLLGYSRNVKAKGDHQPSEFAFLSRDMIRHFVDSEIAITDVQKAVAVAIKDSVMSYTRDKRTAVNVYRHIENFNSSTEEITVRAEGETYTLKINSLIKIASSTEDIY